MLTSALVLWFIVLVLAQLALTNNLSYALALIWSLIIALISLLFLADLDLLGSAMFAVYTSVFLFLTLLGLYLSSYWAGAVAKTTPWAGQSLVLAAVFAVVAWCALGAISLAGTSGFESPSYLPWMSLYSLSQEVFFSAVGALHFSFFRLFVAETLLINVYLLLGLVVAVAALAATRALKAAVGACARLLKNQTTGAFRALSFQVKAVKGFRRQTRRKNSTSTRTRM